MCTVIRNCIHRGLHSTKPERKECLIEKDVMLHYCCDGIVGCTATMVVVVAVAATDAVQ